MGASEPALRHQHFVAGELEPDVFGKRDTRLVEEKEKGDSARPGSSATFARARRRLAENRLCYLPFIRGNDVRPEKILGEGKQDEGSGQAVSQAKPEKTLIIPTSQRG